MSETDATCAICGHIEDAHQNISGDPSDEGSAVACEDCDTDGAYDEETDLYPARIHSFLAQAAAWTDRSE